MRMSILCILILLMISSVAEAQEFSSKRFKVVSDSIELDVDLIAKRVKVLKFIFNTDLPSGRLTHSTPNQSDIDLGINSVEREDGALIIKSSEASEGEALKIDVEISFNTFKKKFFARMIRIVSAREETSLHFYTNGDLIPH